MRRKLTTKDIDTISLRDLESQGIDDKIIVCRTGKRFGIYVLLKMENGGGCPEYIWAQLGTLRFSLYCYPDIRKAIEAMEVHSDCEIYVFDYEDEFIKWVIKEFEKDLESVDLVYMDEI